MKKKRTTHPRRRRIVLDAPLILAFIGAFLILQMLLFLGGWISGQYAYEPMRAAAYDVRARVAAFIAPPTLEPMRAEPAVHFVRISPPPEPVPIPPVELVFTALPPIERPRAEMTAMVRIRKPDFYIELIRDVADRNDVPASLVEAVVRVESDFNARAVSAKGARGLMQVLPETAARFGVDDPDHLFYPAPNLNAGTAYLAWLLKRYEGNLDLALAAYNAGEGAVDVHHGIPPYRETREYVKRVRRALARIAA